MFDSCGGHGLGAAMALELESSGAAAAFEDRWIAMEDMDWGSATALELGSSGVASVMEDFLKMDGGNVGVPLQSKNLKVQGG